MSATNADRAGLLDRFGYADYDAYVAAQRDRSIVNLAHDPTRRVEHLASLLETGTPRRGPVLCIGCRNTHELDLLGSRGWGPVTGIDLQNQASPRILVMDMHATTFGEGAFAAVFASHALEHAIDPDRAAAEMVRIVQPGGRIAIEVPIQYGGRGADLWDFESAEGVAQLFPGCSVVVAEEGEQLDARQRVARLVLETAA